MIWMRARRSMMDSPYMRVKMNGKRFCDEALGMDLMNCYLTSKEDEGHYCQIFDSDYIEQAKRLGLGYEDFESIKKMDAGRRCGTHRRCTGAHCYL